MLSHQCLFFSYIPTDPYNGGESLTDPDFGKLSLRKNQTDTKDAMTIAKFLMDHYEEISQLPV